MKQIITRGKDIIVNAEIHLVFINDKGYAKVLISLAKGKKLFDKRQTIKNRENKVQLDRIKKNN